MVMTNWVRMVLDRLVLLAAFVISMLGATADLKWAAVAFTGGALLGDRLRMLDHSLEKEVFIRSMASRGWSGGLSAAVTDAIRMVEAWGAELIFVETVGIGQGDVEITRIAHAVAVVLMPSSGDDVQVSKAGLMEVGDIYVVNKSDLEGAGQIALHLLAMVRNSKERRQVVRVSAVTGEGMDQLMKAVEALRAKFSGRDGREMRLKSISGMMLELARHRVLASFEDSVDTALIAVSSRFWRTSCRSVRSIRWNMRSANTTTPMPVTAAIATCSARWIGTSST